MQISLLTNVHINLILCQKQLTWQSWHSTAWHKNFCLCLYLSFMCWKPNFRYSSLSFVTLSWGRTMDKFAINWQNFARVGLQLKFAFRVRL